MKLPQLKANVWARYANLLIIALLWTGLRMPFPTTPILLLSLVTLTFTVLVHAYVALTGNWRRAAYLLLAGDLVTTLPAIAYSGFVSSPFMVLLPLTLYSVYFVAFSIRHMIRYGLACILGLAVMFALWRGAAPLLPSWSPAEYPGYTLFAFVMEAIVLGLVTYQSAFLPNPLVEELARQETELVQSQRRAELGTALSQVSHEIRNPLTTVTLSLDLLGESVQGLKGDARTRAEVYIRDSVAELERIHHMLESILSYAREKEGRYVMEPRNIRGMLGRATDFLRLKYGRAKVGFAVSFAMMDAEEVVCDADAMHQILVNLLDNAIQHRSPDRPLMIEFRVHVRSGKVALAVRDNGVGIAPDRLAHIFDKFVSGREGGTGLGLSVVRHLIAGQGGSIDAHSTLGVGTTFSLYLPAGGAGDSAVPGLQPAGAVVTDITLTTNP